MKQAGIRRIFRSSRWFISLHLNSWQRLNRYTRFPFCTTNATMCTLEHLKRQYGPCMNENAVIHYSKKLRTHQSHHISMMACGCAPKCHHWKFSLSSGALQHWGWSLRCHADHPCLSLWLPWKNLRSAPVAAGQWNQYPHRSSKLMYLQGKPWPPIQLDRMNLNSNGCTDGKNHLA